MRKFKLYLLAVLALFALGQPAVKATEVAIVDDSYNPGFTQLSHMDGYDDGVYVQKEWTPPYYSWDSGKTMTVKFGFVEATASALQYDKGYASKIYYPASYGDTPLVLGDAGNEIATLDTKEAEKKLISVNPQYGPYDLYLDIRETPTLWLMPVGEVPTALQVATEPSVPENLWIYEASTTFSTATAMTANDGVFTIENYTIGANPMGGDTSVFGIGNADARANATLWYKLADGVSFELDNNLTVTTSENFANIAGVTPGNYNITLDAVNNTLKLEKCESTGYEHVWIFGCFEEGGNAFTDRKELVQTEPNIFKLEGVSLLLDSHAANGKPFFGMTDLDVTNYSAASYGLSTGDSYVYQIGEAGNGPISEVTYWNMAPYNYVIEPGTYDIVYDVNEAKLYFYTVAEPEPVKMYLFASTGINTYSEAQEMNDLGDGVYELKGVELALFDQNWKDAAFKLTDTLNENGQAVGTYVAGNSVDDLAPSETPYDLKKSSSTIAIPTYVGTYDIKVDLENMKLWLTTTPEPEPEYPEALYFFTGADWNAPGTAMTQVSEGIYELEYEMPVASSGYLNCGISAAQKADDSTSWRKTIGTYYYNAERPTIFGGLADDVLEDQISLIATDGTANFSAANNVIPVTIPKEGENPTYKFVVDLVNMTLTVTRPAPAVEPEYPEALYFFTGADWYAAGTTMTQVSAGIYEMDYEMPVASSGYLNCGISAAQKTDDSTSWRKTIGTYYYNAERPTIFGGLADDVVEDQISLIATDGTAAFSAANNVIPVTIPKEGENPTYKFVVDLVNMTLTVTRPAPAVEPEPTAMYIYWSQADGYTSFCNKKAEMTEVESGVYEAENVTITSLGSYNDGAFVITPESVEPSTSNLQALTTCYWSGIYTTMESGVEYDYQTMAYMLQSYVNPATYTIRIDTNTGKMVATAQSTEPESKYAHIYAFAAFSEGANPYTDRLEMTQTETNVYTLENVTINTWAGYTIFWMTDQDVTAMYNVTSYTIGGAAETTYVVGEEGNAVSQTALEWGSPVMCYVPAGTYNVTFNADEMKLYFESVGAPEYPEAIYMYGDIGKTAYLRDAIELKKSTTEPGVYTNESVMVMRNGFQTYKADNGYVIFTTQQLSNGGKATETYKVGDLESYGLIPLNTAQTIAMSEGIQYYALEPGTYSFKINLADNTLLVEKAAMPTEMYAWGTFGASTNSRVAMTAEGNGVFTLQNVDLQLGNYAGKAELLFTPQNYDSMSELDQAYWVDTEYDGWSALSNGTYDLSTTTRSANFMPVVPGTYDVRLDLATNTVTLSAGTAVEQKVWMWGTFGTDKAYTAKEMTAVDNNTFEIKNVVLNGSIYGANEGCYFFTTEEFESASAVNSNLYVNTYSHTNGGTYNLIEGKTSNYNTPIDAGTAFDFTVDLTAKTVTIAPATVEPTLPATLYAWGTLDGNNYASGVEMTTDAEGIYTIQNLTIAQPATGSTELVFAAAGSGNIAEMTIYGSSTDQAPALENQANVVVEGASADTNPFYLGEGVYDVKVDLNEMKAYFVQVEQGVKAFYAYGTINGAKDYQPTAMTRTAPNVFEMKNVTIDQYYSFNYGPLRFSEVKVDNWNSGIDGNCYSIYNCDDPVYGEKGNNLYKSNSTGGIYMIKLTPGEYDIKVDLNDMKAYFIQLNIPVVEIDPLYAYGSFGGEAYQTQVKFETYEEYSQTFYRINDLTIEAYGDTGLGAFTLSKVDVANGLEAGEYYNAISTQDFTKQMNIALSSTMNPFTPEPGIYDVRVSLNGNNPWISFDRHPDSWEVEPENTPVDVDNAWLRLAPSWVAVPMTKTAENVFEAEINAPAYLSGGNYGAFFLTDIEDGKIQDLTSAYGFYGFTGMATLGEEGNDMWHGTTENLDMVKVPVGKCVVKADFTTMTLTIEVVKEPEPEKDYLWYAGGMNGWTFDFTEIIEGKATFTGTFGDDLGFKVSTCEPSGQWDGWEGFNAGALTTETVLTSGATVELTAGEGNITLAESGNWTIVVDVENKTITATGGTSIETIEGAEAEAVYFTLQGARVDNPAPGIVYIVRRGANVTKELYFTK